MAPDFLLFYLWGVLQNRPTLGAERRFRPVRLPALALPRQGAPGFYETPPAGGEMAKVSAFHARVYHIPTLSASLYRKERESVEMLENLRILPSAPTRVYHTRPCPAYGKPCVFSFTTTCKEEIAYNGRRESWHTIIKEERMTCALCVQCRFASPLHFPTFASPCHHQSERNISSPMNHHHSLLQSPLSTITSPCWNRRFATCVSFRERGSQRETDNCRNSACWYKTLPHSRHRPSALYRRQLCSRQKSGVPASAF